MGRPPLSDHAMSAAERQRRRRAKFRDENPRVTKPTQFRDTPDNARVTEQAAALAEANARIATLEASIAVLTKAPTWAKDRAENEALRQKLKVARARISALKEEIQITVAVGRALLAGKGASIQCSAELHRWIKVRLHPDRAPAGKAAEWNKRAAEFGGLKFVEVTI